MPRPPRADEAGGLYHALNRGNLRATIFHKQADFDAFERILYEALQIHQIELYSYQLMPNHYHLVLRPLVDGEMSRFMGWVGGTHTMRYHAHYHTSGQGHVYQQRYKSFPIQDDAHFFVVCRYVERNALRARLVERAEQWRWGSLSGWLEKPHRSPALLSPWPMARLPRWIGIKGSSNRGIRGGNWNNNSNNLSSSNRNDNNPASESNNKDRKGAR
jgi:putative transposase